MKRTGKRIAFTVLIVLIAFTAISRADDQATISTPRTLPSLELGNTGIKDVIDVLKALDLAHCHFTRLSKRIFGNPAFTVSPDQTEVEPVIVSVGDLGFKGAASLPDIYKRAQEVGFDLCPAEVGPQMCLQYKDVPEKDQTLIIGMRPVNIIQGTHTEQEVFDLQRDYPGTLMINGRLCFSDPDTRFAPCELFVFLKSRK